VWPNLLLKFTAKRVAQAEKIMYVGQAAGFGSQSYERKRLEPILRLLNLQLQSKRFSRLERCLQKRKKLIIKTRYAISCTVNFYNAGVVTQSCRIG
jgi:hypothetical protein